MQNRIRYLAILSVTVATTIVFAGMFNLCVDPYGTFRLFEISRFNRIKLYPDHDIATIKLNALRNARPDALILGNSRAEVGFDPKHAAWGKRGFRSVYNAAVPGAGIGTAWNFLRQSEATHRPEFVLLGIEFFDFLGGPDKPITPDKGNARGWRDDVLWGVRATLTMQALIDSLTTVRIQFQKNPAQLTERGFNPLLEYKDSVRVEGYYAFFRQRAEENARNHALKPANLFARGTSSSTDFEHLRAMVRWSLKNQVELRMVIFPYHAQLLVMIDELGLWPLFEEWKRQVTRVIDQERAIYQSGPQVKLVDFSGFSRFATEPVPKKGDLDTEVKWYWEAGHFKRELGDLVVTRCLELGVADKDDGFGFMVDARNIEAHLQRLRSDKELFITANLNLVQEVSELVSRAKRAARK